MKTTCFPVGLLETNCYVIEDNDAAAIIDPGGYSKALDDKLSQLGDKVKLILLTHCHFDHTNGIKRVKQRCDVPICIFETDADGLSDPRRNGLQAFESLFDLSYNADIRLHDGETIALGEAELKVIHTPGHTSGSCCYLCENTIFSGDTLFRGSFGRTDIGDGSFPELYNSIQALFKLVGDYTVFPGHGKQTTLEFERKNNLIIRSKQ